MALLVTPERALAQIAGALRALGWDGVLHDEKGVVDGLVAGRPEYVQAVVRAMDKDSAGKQASSQDGADGPSAPESEAAESANRPEQTPADRQTVTLTPPKPRLIQVVGAPLPKEVVQMQRGR